MHLRAAFGKVLVLICSAAVAACSTTAATTGHIPPSVTKAPPVGEAPPPLIVRLANDRAGGETLPGAAGELLKPAAASVLGGLVAVPLTFGASVLLIPVGISAGVIGAQRASECAERWNALFGDARGWMATNVARAPISPRLGTDIKRMTQGSEPAVAVHVLLGRAVGGPEAIGQRLSATSVVLADIEFRVEFSGNVRDWPNPLRCGLSFRASGTLALERLGDRKILAERRFTFADEISEGDIASWAADPASAPARLDRFITRTAEQVVLTYPWLAATEVLSSSGPVNTGAYCALNTPAKLDLISCAYDTLEQCQSVIASTQGECVPRTAALPRWCFLKSSDSNSWSYTTNCAALDPLEVAKAVAPAGLESTKPVSPSGLEIAKPVSPSRLEGLTWCLMDPSSPVSCDFPTYEECVAKKPDANHRCVLKD